MKIAFVASALAALLWIAAPHAAFAELSSEQRAEAFNLEGKLGLKGYDPVSYFEGEPKEGSEEISYAYEGVTYRFASEQNKERFQENPGKYEPAYGGWCAWAMLDGSKADIDPLSYTITDGRLLVFYDGIFGDTLKKWKDKSGSTPEQELLKKADTEWKKIVG